MDNILVKKKLNMIFTLNVQICVKYNFVFVRVAKPCKVCGVRPTRMNAQVLRTNLGFNYHAYTNVITHKSL